MSTPVYVLVITMLCHTGGPLHSVTRFERGDHTLVEAVMQRDYEGLWEPRQCYQATAIVYRDDRIYEQLDRLRLTDGEVDCYTDGYGTECNFITYPITK